MAPRAAASTNSADPKAQVRGIISRAGNTCPLFDGIARQVEHVQHYLPKSKEEDEKELSKLRATAARFQEPGFENRIPRRETFAGIPAPYLIDVSLEKNNPINIMNMKLSETPILLLQGDKDWQVHVKHDSQAWNEGLIGTAERFSVKLYEGLNHCFLRSNGDGLMLHNYDVPSHVPENVLQDIVEWIERHYHRWTDRRIYRLRSEAESVLLPD